VICLRIVRSQCQQVLCTLHHIGVGKLLVEDRYVGEPHALHRKMAVRIELYANDAVRPHDSTGTFQHVAFDIIVAVRDHRAVQAEQHTVER
jgi:hypothetical protein